MDDAAGWNICSYRTTGSDSQLDKTSGCTLKSGKDADYALKLGGAIGWAL